MAFSFCILKDYAKTSKVMLGAMFFCRRFFIYLLKLGTIQTESIAYL